MCSPYCKVFGQLGWLWLHPEYTSFISRAKSVRIVQLSWRVMSVMPKTVKIGHLTGCSGVDLHNLVSSASSAKSAFLHIIPKKRVSFKR